MLAEGTILALSSPAGRAARAMLRLSGPAVPRVLELLFGVLPPRGGSRAVLGLGSGVNLPILLAYFPAPHSYTGEHLAEVQFPGNPLLVERVQRLLLTADSVRPATPGEFTARAYLNNRLTLDQAEGIALTIAAEAADDLLAARRLTSGQTGDVYRAWSEELATLLALVEAGIDFTDQEDVVPIPPAVLTARARSVRDDMAHRLGARRGRESASSLPLVVLAGLPNAGKSTLFNALLGRRRAVTSPEAGTTRDVLAEPLDLSRDAPGAGPVMLADLAGLDGIEDPDRATGGLSASARGQTLPPGHHSKQAGIEQQSQTRALEALARADVIIHCDPRAIFAPLPPSTAAVIHVRTKADLPTAAASPESLSICALDGRNLAALRHRIAQEVRGSGAGAEAILIPHHRTAIALAADRLADALATIPPDAPRLQQPELTAGLLRESLDALGELTGRISPDDIIGKVFATFCIGK